MVNKLLEQNCFPELDFRMDFLNALCPVLWSLTKRDALSLCGIGVVFFLPGFHYPHMSLYMISKLQSMARPFLA